MEGRKGMEVKESSSEDAVAYYNYSSYTTTQKITAIWLA